MDVLLQVNVAQEPQKSGCSPDDVGDIAGHVIEHSAALKNQFKGARS